MPLKASQSTTAKKASLTLQLGDEKKASVFKIIKHPTKSKRLEKGRASHGERHGNRKRALVGNSAQKTLNRSDGFVTQK